MSKSMKPLRILLTGFLCIALSILPVPKASAVSVEYPILFALILVAALTASESDLPQGSQVVVNQLQTAVEGARAANMVGNRAAELSRLSKAIGATEALLGMTSACDECGDLKDVLQQIIGQAALLKTSALDAYLNLKHDLQDVADKVHHADIQVTKLMDKATSLQP